MNVADNKNTRTPDKELADMIGTVQYGWDPTNKQKEFARSHNLVIVYGASDDLCELEGAISDEIGCFDGGSISDFSAELRNAGIELDAVWDGCDSEYTWSYRINRPAEHFCVEEDGEKYCEGLVFPLGEG